MSTGVYYLELPNNTEPCHECGCLPALMEDGDWLMGREGVQRFVMFCVTDDCKNGYHARAARPRTAAQAWNRFVLKPRKPKPYVVETEVCRFTENGTEVRIVSIWKPGQRPYYGFRVGKELHTGFKGEITASFHAGLRCKELQRAAELADEIANS